METIAPLGLLQPLPILHKIWSNIIMDFILGLLSYIGKTIILVVVDRLSKNVHFIALFHLCITATVAQAFINNVFQLHGMPNSIVSYRDPIFLVSFGKGNLKYKVPNYA